MLVLILLIMILMTDAATERVLYYFYVVDEDLLNNPQLTYDVIVSMDQSSKRNSAFFPLKYVCTSIPFQHIHGENISCSESYIFHNLYVHVFMLIFVNKCVVFSDEHHDKDFGCSADVGIE